jgi:hypothetical protein
MTIEPVEGLHTGAVRVDVPARTNLANRVTVVDD